MPSGGLKEALIVGTAAAVLFASVWTASVAHKRERIIKEKPPISRPAEPTKHLASEEAGR
jgi:hypothetical protein